MIRLFKHLRPYAAAVAGVLILVYFQSLSELYLPTLMSDIVNNGIVKGDTQYIYRTGGYMLLVALGGTVCAVIAGYLASRTGTGFARDLRSKVFNRVENYSLDEFDKIGTASLITRTTNDITQMQQLVTMMLRIMVSAPMMCIGGILMAVRKDASLSRIIAVIIPILAIVIFIVANRAVPLFKAMQKKLDKLNLVFREGLTGIRVIRAFNRIDHETKRFDAANLDLTSTAVKVNRMMASMMPLMMLILNFSTIAIIWYGGQRIDQAQMQVGDLMAFIQYVMQIMFSFIMVSMIFVMVPRASASAVRINEVLDTAPTITDPEQPVHGGEQRGHVEFRNVSFSYAGAEQPALSEISFAANPGEVTAIIGGTGSGKSTLISLIPRFYDVSSGTILIDGVDLRSMSQADLRSRIGFVPQTALLFSGTIAENIRYGKEDATDEEVRQAAEIAQATEFISAMPDGFNSQIAQGGTNVSGGQKQRLSIARALVRRPEIYVFDDSFSALDFKTDAKLRAALRRETADATVIIVAQRVSTVMDADRIIVLDEGQVAGIGTHRVLMNNCEVYREIVSSQLSEEEIA
ncbi:MAG: ABC transporter ATP-binding protein [Bacillota bacterium]